MKPLSPNEVSQSAVASIPDFVSDIVNKCLVLHWDGCGATLIAPELLANRDEVTLQVAPAEAARAGEIWDIALTDPAAYLALGDDPRDLAILAVLDPRHPALTIHKDTDP